ncbi:MAG: hypothetical protein Fur0022_44670 [Anaerolineales bacterium]
MTLTWMDLLVIWLVPPLFCAFLFVLFSFGLYGAIVSPFSFLFKQDIEYKFAKKKRLRSGQRLKWGYVYFLGLLLFDNGVQATFLYRLSRFFLTHHLRSLALVCHSFSKFLTHIDISPYAEIGPGLTFYHGMGVVIGKFTTIGSRVTICQGVTTGSGRPKIGDDVILWAGAKVLGNVTVGEASEVAANAVVISDVPANCVALGVPAKRFLPKTKTKLSYQNDEL